MSSDQTPLTFVKLQVHKLVHVDVQGPRVAVLVVAQEVVDGLVLYPTALGHHVLALGVRDDQHPGVAQEHGPVRAGGHAKGVTQQNESEGNKCETMNTRIMVPSACQSHG